MMSPCVSLPSSLVAHFHYFIMTEQYLDYCLRYCSNVDTLQTCLPVCQNPLSNGFSYHQGAWCHTLGHLDCYLNRAIGCGILPCLIDEFSNYVVNVVMSGVRSSELMSTSAKTIGVGNIFRIEANQGIASKIVALPFELIASALFFQHRLSELLAFGISLVQHCHRRAWTVCQFRLVTGLSCKCKPASASGTDRDEPLTLSGWMF